MINFWSLSVQFGVMHIRCSSNNDKKLATEQISVSSLDALTPFCCESFMFHLSVMKRLSHSIWFMKDGE